MKISTPSFNDDRFMADIRKLITQPSVNEAPICAQCCFNFSDYGSESANDICSMNCQYASQNLSSDPKRYPIEQNIVPIVYALSSLKVTVPCWSCEGHVNNEGILTKLPQTWFYSASSIYTKLISEALSALKNQRQLTYEWVIIILPYSQSKFLVTYSIEPKYSDINSLELVALHEDILTIGANLRHDVITLAKKY